MPEEQIDSKTLQKDNALDPNSKSRPRDKSDDADFPFPLKDMPPEVRRSFQLAMMSTSVPRSHPLFDKFNDSHIDKFLDYAQKDDDNEFLYRCSSRWFHLVYALVAVAFFIFLTTYLLPYDKALLYEILKLSVVFSGGIGSGYGLKTYFDKKK